MSFSLNEYGVLVFKNAPKLIREVFNDEACKKYLQIFSFLIKFRYKKTKSLKKNKNCFFIYTVIHIYILNVKKKEFIKIS